MNENSDIDAKLIRAVTDGDHQVVARIYADAAQRAEKEGDMDRACFLMTHAWVFALEAGDDTAEEYKRFLTRAGRV